MDQTRRDQIASMHDSQRQRASAYKPTVPEIPTKHGCAGVCSMPPPPPPVSNETFRDGSSVGLPSEWWLILGSASVIYMLLCLHVRRT